MQPPDPAAEEALIAHLLQFVTPARRARMEQALAARTARIRVVLEDIALCHNASAVIRTCDCFGVQHLHVVENRYKYELNRDVAMGSAKWVELHRHRGRGADNTRACLDELRGLGYRIVATSLDPGSTPLGGLPVGRPLALWFGNEEEGLSATVLREADERVHIPMLGFTQSLNISVSAAICLHELRGRLDRSGADTGLDPAGRRRALRLWLRGTLKNHQILEKAFLEGLRGPA